MANIVVIGTQWGDEGKGKIVDYLAKDFDIIARYQGGHNAGHTVFYGGQVIILHLVPTGILHAGKKCVIGNGVVVDLKALLNEITALNKFGIRVTGNLFISKRAHLIFPYHRETEKLGEEIKGRKKIGTTGRGIGPAYTDKVARVGITIADLLDAEILREKLSLNIENKGGTPTLDEAYLDKLCQEYSDYGEKIKTYITDTSSLINDAIERGEHILFEGAQGTLLDVDHGSYPFVTSSNTTAGGACVGLGVGPTKIDGVLGVAKAYTTRVGNGPFPTELNDEKGMGLRGFGNEYGATTGRPRRCGWFDAVAVRYAVRINGVEAIAITKLDILDEYETINICSAYEWCGKQLAEFPAETRIMREATPIYEELPGWKSTTRGITSYQQLPAKTKSYLERIGELIGANIALVSTGPRREETIFIANNPFQHWL